MGPWRAPGPAGRPEKSPGRGPRPAARRGTRAFRRARAWRAGGLGAPPAFAPARRCFLRPASTANVASSDLFQPLCSCRGWPPTRCRPCPPTTPAPPPLRPSPPRPPPAVTIAPLGGPVGAGAGEEHAADAAEQ
ncbi:Protein of unknown function [Gryllus bimaculatus]|nr:Protein of unknown function [Gryllus bimaculatus]